MPLNGWNKLEASLVKKETNRKMAWWMAASVVLGFGLFGITYKNNNFKVNKNKVHEVAQGNKQVSDANFQKQLTIKKEVSKSMKTIFLNSKKPTSVLNLVVKIKTNLNSNVIIVNTPSANWSPKDVVFDNSLLLEATPIVTPIHIENYKPTFELLNPKNTLNTPSTFNLIALKLSKANKQNNWLWSVGIGPMVNNVKTTLVGDAKYIHKDYGAVQKNAQKAAVSNAIEINVAKRAFKNLYTTVGFGLSQQVGFYSYNFKQTPIATDNTQLADKFGNYPIVSYFDALATQVSFKTTSKATVVKMPIGVLFNHAINNKWSLITQAAIAPSFLTGKKGNSLSYSDLNIIAVDKDWYSKVALSTQAGVGIYKTFGSSKIGLQIQAQYMPFGIYKVGASVNQKPLDFGLKIQWIGGFTKP